MKQIIQRIFTCLILGVVFCTTAWAQSGPEMGVAYKVTTQTWGTDWAPKKIPAIAFNSEAKSVKIKVVNAHYAAINNGNGKEGSQNGDIYVISYNTINASGMTFNISNSEYLATAKAGNLYLRIGGGENYEIYVTNYATADGATNDTGNTSGGTTGSGDSGAGEEGNTGGNTSSGGQGGSVDPSSMAYKIAHKQQLTNVPTIYLTVPDAQGKELKTVLYKDRTTNTAEYHTATIQVVDNSEAGSPQHLESFTDYVQIKVRGNSTADPDKKPYRLKFAKEIKDADGNVIANCLKHDLLGQGYTKRNWALMANYFDRSMIRNALTYHLGKYLGLDFCPGYKFVDVVINGDYRGTYQITDHVEAGTDRVDIDEDNDWMIETVSWDNMLDTDYGIKASTASSTNSNITIPYNTNVKNPEPADDVAWAKLKDDVITWEREWNTSFQNSSKTTGWQAYNDVESFIKYYLAMNITDDYDGFFVMKGYRKTDGPFFWGPIWDKDLAYGNCSYTPTKAHLTEEIDNGLFRWNFINFLHNDCAFMSRVKYTLDKLIADGVCEKLCKDVDDLTELIDETKTLNYSTWSLTTDCGIGVYTYSDYSQHATQLKTFLRNRFDYLKDRIHTMCSGLGCEDYVEEEPDDTPTGDLGALVDLGDGKYSYTGSASTFKEGTEITITTSSEGTTLSNYITEGNAWNTTKTITLTADDVTALAANDYTFYMNATGGEVKAVTVKVPAEQGGLSAGSPNSWGGTAYTYKFAKSDVRKGTKVNFTFAGTGDFHAEIFTTNQYSADYASIGHQTSLTRTLDENDVAKIIENNYSIKIVAYNCTNVSVEVVPSSSGSTGTPTHTLTLNASEGGTVTGAGEYAEGTTVLIKAIPNEGYRFSKWSDDNTHAVRSVTLNEAITLTATFVSDDTPAIRKQLTNLPTIYLDAATVDDAWKGVALEVFDKDNVFGQGVTWTKTTADVSAQYQGSGDKNKDSYRLKFESKIKLMGANKYKQWVLLANDDDPSMINNALAKELGDAVGMPWTPGYQFVDLYVNDEYMGTYQVTDRVKAEEGRSLVSSGDKNNDWQVRFNDDAELEEDGTQDYIKATNGVHVIYKNPDPKDLTAEQLTALRKDMKDYFDNVFTKTDGTYPNFAANVDKDQLINWYICQEILGVYKGFSSIEAYRSVTETAADNLLHFGPLWDSEKAFGNLGGAPAMSMADKETANSYLGLMTNYAAYTEMKDLFKYLWTENWFKSGVISKWNTLYTGSIESGLAQTLKTKATEISGTLSASQPKNLERWEGSLGGSTSYAAAVEAISTYIDARFPYLDAKFNELAGDVCQHTYANNAYVNNGDGTHSPKCDKCDYVNTEVKTAHSYTAKDNHPYCDICKATETATVEGPVTNDTKVYRIHEAAKATDIKYITAESTFAPSGNKIYICNEEITGETNLKNVVWPRSVDNDYNGNEIVLSDGDYTYDEKANMHVKTASYTRSMSSTWGTLCLPFKVKSCDDYTLYEISNTKIGDDNKSGTIVFSEITEASGLKPVVFRKNTSAGSVTFRGVAQTEGANNGLVTVKKSKKLGNTDALVSTGVEGSGTWALYGNVKKSNNTAEISPDYSNVYYIASNKFWQGDGHVTVGTFRSVFVFTPAPGNEAAAKSFAIAIGDNATAINDNVIDKNLAIFTGNGEVILNSNYDTKVSIYNINGTSVVNTNLEKDVEKSFALPKGIYIINGTKVAVK